LDKGELRGETKKKDGIKETRGKERRRRGDSGRKRVGGSVAKKSAWGTGGRAREGPRSPTAAGEREIVQGEKKKRRIMPKVEEKRNHQRCVDARDEMHAAGN